jgi:beta-phosphoglucomutase family hydrolase
MTNKLTADSNARALIFDLDGTLLDSMALHWEAWETVCTSHGISIEKDFFMSLTGKPVEEISQIIVSHYNSDAEPEAILKEKQTYTMQRLPQIKPVEAVANVLFENAGKLPMAVGTGSDRKRALAMLDNAGLTKYFSAIVCAEDVENHKPAPDTFLRCAELMGVEPKFCQVFEDGAFGIKAAEDGGMIATDVKPYY